MPFKSEAQKGFGAAWPSKQVCLSRTAQRHLLHGNSEALAAHSAGSGPCRCAHSRSAALFCLNRCRPWRKPVFGRCSPRPSRHVDHAALRTSGNATNLGLGQPHVEPTSCPNGQFGAPGWILAVAVARNSSFAARRRYSLLALPSQEGHQIAEFLRREALVVIGRHDRGLGDHLLYLFTVKQIQLVVVA